MILTQVKTFAAPALVVLLLAAAAQVFPVGVAAVATVLVADRRRHSALTWARLAAVLEIAFLAGMSAHCAGEEWWAIAFESPWEVASRHLPAAATLTLLTGVLVATGVELFRNGMRFVERFRRVLFSRTSDERAGGV